MNTDPQQPTRAIDAPPAPGGEVEIDLMNLLVRAMRGYKIVLAFTLAAIALSVAISLALPKTYTAQAVFLPPVNADQVQAAEATSLLLRQDPSDLYLGLLASRSVADSVIDAAHLMQVYHLKLRSQARILLAKRSDFSVEKNALISVKITTQDPKLSADIGNAYLDALYKLNGSMSGSASSHRSQFFEEQLQEEKNALAEAEFNLQQMQEKTGTVLPQEEAQAGLTATARLQANVEEDEARLSSLLTGSTEQNPEVVRLRAQIVASKSQLRQQQISESSAPGTGLPSTAKMPELMLDYVRKSRDLKEREALYDSLTQQYQKARLAALDPGPQLEVVDRAEVPDHKSGPPRTRIVAVGALLGFILGLFSVLLAPSLRRLVSRFRETAAQVSEQTRER